jgi:hypothetical protein
MFQWCVKKKSKPIREYIFTFSLFASNGIDFGCFKKLQALSIKQEVAKFKMLKSN